MNNLEVSSNARAIDLIVARLVIPNVSSPPSSTCACNTHNSAKIGVFFEFAHAYLHKEASMLIFLLEIKQVRDDVKTFVGAYEFIVAKDWWGFNELHLCSI